jgi:hypothetical protein
MIIYPYFCYFGAKYLFILDNSLNFFLSGIPANTVDRVRKLPNTRYKVINKSIVFTSSSWQLSGSKLVVSFDNYVIFVELKDVIWLLNRVPIPTYF